LPPPRSRRFFALPFRGAGGAAEAGARRGFGGRLLSFAAGGFEGVVEGGGEAVGRRRMGRSVLAAGLLDVPVGARLNMEGRRELPFGDGAPGRELGQTRRVHRRRCDNRRCAHQGKNHFGRRGQGSPTPVARTDSLGTRRVVAECGAAPKIRKLLFGGGEMGLEP